MKHRPILGLTSVVIFVATFSLLSIFQNCAPPKQQQIAESSAAGLILSSSEPTNGQCSAVNNSCITGDFLNVPDNMTHSLWQCRGLSGGRNVNCSLPLQLGSAIPARCGLSVNSCDPGNLIDRADSSTQYLWTCEGINGGAPSGCSKQKPLDPNSVSGRCGINRNVCLSGVLFDTTDSPTQYLWDCNGVGTGTSISCSQNISSAPVHARCGSGISTCLPGNLVELPDGTSTYNWACTGLNGGNSTNCQLLKPSCTLQVQPITHVGQTANIRVVATSGVLPSRIRVKFHGTKAPMNGLNPVIDARGEPANTFDVDTPANIPVENTDGLSAGVYTRYAIIYSADSAEQEICRTPTVVGTLTPACGLSISSQAIRLGQTYSFAAALPLTSEQPSLAATATTIGWFETKTVSGTTSTTLNNSPLSVANFNPDFEVFTQTSQTTLVGSYSRYYIAYDSTMSKQLCRSNRVSYTVDLPVAAAAPPPQNPTQTPTQTQTQDPLPDRDIGDCVNDTTFWRNNTRYVCP